MTGTVVLSLDFELGWGHADVRPAYVDELRASAGENFDRIGELMDLFDEYSVPATWAVVGKLTEPGDDPLYHNPALFESLLDATVDHDVGLHSHGHRAFTDLSTTEARADLESGVAALREWGVRPRSFIYPRNRIAHTSLLSDAGFRCYRSNRSRSRLDSLTELLIPPVASPGVTAGESGLSAIPETMFLAARRPIWHRRWVARRAVERIASDGGLVHLWWHPHNVVTEPGMLDLLADLLERLTELRERHELRCRTMADLAQ